MDALRYGPRFLVADARQFRSLLAKIVENTLRDQHDWARARKRAAEREVPVPSDTYLELDPRVRSVTRPSVAVDRQLRQKWVRLALELLQPDDRQLIRWRDWDGLSFESMGERLGVSWNAARMRYQRALPRLLTKIRELQGRPLSSRSESRGDHGG